MPEPQAPPGTRPIDLQLARDSVTIGKSGGIEALGALDQKLATSAPELVAILRSAPVESAIEVYRREDAEAIGQQQRLMREATLANICVTLAGVCSGLVLAGAASQDALKGLAYLPNAERLLLWLGMLTILLGAAAAMFGHVARDQGRLQRWMARRGGAEMARHAVFRAIATAAAMPAAAPDPVRRNSTAIHGLAIVTVHLLDDQRRYLATTAKRHRRSSEWTSRLGGIATALAFIGGSGAIIGSYSIQNAWVAIAGVIGAAVAAYAANREALRRDRGNADRYEKTLAALDELTARRDAIARDIEDGKPEALTTYTEAVTAVLANDHKQWLEGAEQIGGLIDKLDSQLDAMRKKPE